MMRRTIKVLIVITSAAGVMTHAPHAAAIQQESAYLGKLRDEADAGKVEAQCALANIYLNGAGVVKNPAEAFKWWRKAADQE
jgi:TPR repeat protein